MRSSRHRLHISGLTLVELLVVIGLVGILIAVVAPSMQGLISAKRVQGISDGIVTDVQYARSEAARRNRDVRIGFQASDTLSCYVLFVEPVVPPVALPASQVNGGLSGCDCSLPPGQPVCSAGRVEIKTVQVPRSAGVSFSASSADGPTLNFGGDFGRLKSASSPAPDAMPVPVDISVTGTPRGQLRTRVNESGRPSMCSPDGSISGAPRC